MSTLGPAGSVLGAPLATLGNLMPVTAPDAPWAHFDGGYSASSIDDGALVTSGVWEGS